MAGTTDKVLPHLESVEPWEILDNARDLERFDYLAGRDYRSGKSSRQLTASAAPSALLS